MQVLSFSTLQSMGVKVFHLRVSRSKQKTQQLSPARSLLWLFLWPKKKNLPVSPRYPQSPRSFSGSSRRKKQLLLLATASNDAISLRWTITVVFFNRFGRVEPTGHFCGPSSVAHEPRKHLTLGCLPSSQLGSDTIRKLPQSVIQHHFCGGHWMPHFSVDVAVADVAVWMILSDFLRSHNITIQIAKPHSAMYSPMPWNH